MGGEFMNNQKKESLKQLFKETFQQITTDSKSFIEFLNQIKLLHKYDLSSQLFIHGQKPHATHIASFDTWKRLGRSVKKGEKAITVISRENGHMVVNNFFDVSQTVGKEIHFPDYSLHADSWLLFFSQEIQDQVDEQIDLNTDPFIRRLSIDLGISLAKSKSLGAEVPNIKESELTQLQNFPLFVEILTNVNTINQLLSKEILVYKKERMKEDELRILRERDRTIDSKNRVSTQRTTRKIWKDSSREASRGESSGISNQANGGRFDEVGSRDQRESVESNRRAARSTGRSESTDRGTEERLRRSSQDSDSISGTSNRDRNERDFIEKEVIPVKGSEEAISSESFSILSKAQQVGSPLFSEQEILNILKRGTGTVDGRIRVYQTFQRTTFLKERIDFLKDEFGWYGSTLNMEGSSFSMMDCRPGRGISLLKTIDGQEYKQVLKWKEVAERLELLIRQNNYLTEEEWQKIQLEQERTDQAGILKSDDEELTLFDFEEYESPKKKLASESMTNESSNVKSFSSDGEITEEVQETANDAFSFEMVSLDTFYPKTAREKIKANIEAIRLSKEISQTPGRKATSKEQEQLAKYVGWGGLAAIFDERDSKYISERNQLKVLLSAEEYRLARESVLTAYYTDPRIIQAIYQKIKDMGFKGGSILDPSAGTGNFFSAMPKSLREQSTLYGVELDETTGRIAQQLHPDAYIQLAGFEQIPLNKEKFDLVISNIPFDSFQIEDENYAKNYSLHDYFIKKALDSTKNGGIVAVITSMSTLDKLGESTRREYASVAELLGAVRLPNNAFKRIAGTDVVTDILFFRKDTELEQTYTPDWVFVGKEKDFPEVAINNYFRRNRDMILGELSVKNFHGKTLTVNGVNEDLISDLSEALSKIEGEFSASEIQEKVDLSPVAMDKENQSIDLFNYGVIDGELYFNDAGELEKYKGSQNKAKIIKAFVEIKAALLAVIELQRRTDYSQAEFSLVLSKLNRQYDSFVSIYGSIDKNIKVFERDEYYPLLKSVEDVQKDGSVKKGMIFFEATIRQVDEVTHVDTAQEALNFSINRKLCVDLDYMLSIYPKDKATIVEELGNAIFINPVKFEGDMFADVWETREEYLSGDVKQKLAEAKLATDKHAELFARNVTALESAQPTPLKVGEIDYSLGATWIPTEVYQTFMYDLLETSQLAKKYDLIKIEYDVYASKYYIKGKTRENNALTTNRYGTRRANAYVILEDSLNLLKVEVRDRVIDENGKKYYELNAKETMYARTKQEELQETFKSWVMNHTEVLEQLHEIYEDRFNRIVLRKYDGSQLAFPGLNQKITLRPAQQNVVARILHTGRVLMAHSVGAGKTLSMISAGMMLKEHGLINKPLYVVPNHLVGDFGTELLRFYPAKKVLITTKKDFEKSRRKEFVSRIATGSYDAIIIGHGQFEKITLSPERQKKMLQEEIDQVTNAIADYQMNNEGDSWSIKQIIAFEKKLKDRLKKLNQQDKKDHMLYFEDLGVDFLFVDEAHLYKNLYSYTKLSNVAGVNSSNSLRASDMEMKVKYILEENNNRGVVFATGTPISNSMSEMFTMQKYLQPDVLRSYGVSHFDAWASTFGEIISSLEINPEGSGYQMKNRFARFHNLPELMTMFNLVADIQTSDMLKLPVPAVQTGKAQIVVTEPIQYQKDKIEELGDRAAAIRAKQVAPDVDNMLKITNEAKLMALDPRLLDDYDEIKYDPAELKQTKLATCANKVYGIWKETADTQSTQMIFSDSGTPNQKRFNVYDEMKRLLVAKGIPEEEIVFIHDAKNDKQRESMFEKMRHGTIRIMLGSTSKVGTGTNVQNKLIAAHHIDCPWRPADIAQRDGRIVRQGNENTEVQIYRYVTKSTFDSYLWQIQEQKQTYISQVMTGKAISRSVDELSETVLDASEVKAIATGNPLIAEKMKLDNEITRLRMLQSAHLNEQEGLKRSINESYPQLIQSTKQSIEQLEKDIALANEYSRDEFTIEFQTHMYDSRAEAAEVVNQLCSVYCRSEEYVEVGEYKGFSINLKRSETQFGMVQVRLQSEGGKYTTTLDPEAGIGSIRRIENIIHKLSEQLLEKQESLKETKDKLAIAKKQVGQPFPREEELKEKVAEQTRINTEIEFSLKKQSAISRTEALTDEIETHEEMIIEEREM